VPLQAEILVDRRRLKRRLTLWRLFAVIAVIVLGTALLFQDENIAAALGYKSHIARVNVSGIIQDNRNQQALLEKLAKAKHVKAVILRVNSPGGTATGGEALFAAIRAVAEKKPVVAVFGTIATSSAYIVGLATDHIVARGNTITGSVGVILQWAEVTELLKKIGVKMEEIKSGPLKATPSPFQPLDDASRALTEEMIAEAHNWFLNLVATRRSISPQNVPGLTDGRIFSGRQALEHKLIDSLGGEDDAVKWLERERKIAKGLPVLDWTEEDKSNGGLWGASLNFLVRSAGFNASVIDALLSSSRAINSVQLDGLISLWHPSDE